MVKQINLQAPQDGQVDQDDLFVPEERKNENENERSFRYTLMVVSSQTGAQEEELNVCIYKKKKWELSMTCEIFAALQGYQLSPQNPL